MKSRKVEISEMSFKEFSNMVEVSMENICKDIFHENRDSIKIKKEKVAVKNLTLIFNSTLKLSNRIGFQSMSLRDLSAASGLSMGALYSYFKSKDELAKIIQEQGRRITSDILDQEIGKGVNLADRMHRAVRAHLYLSEVMQEWFYFSFMEAKNLTREEQKRAIESELATENIFFDIIVEGEKAGLFKKHNPFLSASIIKGMLQDWYLKRWKYKNRGITVEGYADFVIEFIEAFILIKK
ncbi:MAG: TetR/AcrR family transcriptional regulator [Spirochaetota bacterium]